MTWIDFKTLRKGLSLEEVLKFYGVEVKKRKPGHRHQGFCPLPTHQGKRRSPSFSAKLDHGVWQCFGCKASGNVLDFAVRMEGLDPANPQDLRTVALKLQERFKVPGAEDRGRREGKRDAPPERLPPRPAHDRALPPPSNPDITVVVNPPLDFTLKELDPDHPYLKGRGFMPETIRHFGLGYCNRGLMKGRVAIPLHDGESHLLGYAGRLADESQVSETNPKYLFPGARERDGKRLEFRKSLLVYNANRVKWPVEDLIVVEGFPACWWLWQWGYRNVVALMGSSCSEEQARTIVSGLVPGGRLWAFPDAGPGGEQCAASILTQVAPHCFCRWVRVGAGQPTDCTPGDLERLLWQL